MIEVYDGLIRMGGLRRKDLRRYFIALYEYNKVKGRRNLWEGQ